MDALLLGPQRTVSSARAFPPAPDADQVSSHLQHARVMHRRLEAELDRSDAEERRPEAERRAATPLEPQNTGRAMLSASAALHREAARVAILSASSPAWLSTAAAVDGEDAPVWSFSALRIAASAAIEGDDIDEACATPAAATEEKGLVATDAVSPAPQRKPHKGLFSTTASPSPPSPLPQGGGPALPPHPPSSPLVAGARRLSQHAAAVLAPLTPASLPVADAARYFRGADDAADEPPHATLLFQPSPYRPNRLRQAPAAVTLTHIPRTPIGGILEWG